MDKSSCCYLYPIDIQSITEYYYVELTLVNWIFSNATRRIAMFYVTGNRRKKRLKRRSQHEQRPLADYAVQGGVRQSQRAITESLNKFQTVSQKFLTFLIKNLDCYISFFYTFGVKIDNDGFKVINRVDNKTN